MMKFPSLPLLGKNKQNDLVGFDFSERQLKIAHVHVGALKAEVVELISCDTQGLSDSKISELIATTLAGLEISKPRAFLAVPMQTVVTRSIEIPSRDPAEIREIVNLQASRHTPYSRSEVIIDTLLLGVVRESYTKALFVIAPKDNIIRQTKIIENANLKIERVFFPPEGLCQAITKILDTEASNKAVVVVHMDSDFTSFVVIQEGNILFVRAILIGANHLLEDKEVYHDQFVEELRSSLEAYGAEEAGPQPSLLLLTGVVAEMTDLDALFDETLHIPLKHQAYFNYFPISKRAKAVASSSTHVSFFNLIAPLLLFDKMKINLISDEHKLKIQLEERGREIVKTGVLAMIFFTMIFLSFASKVYFKNAYLKNLTARYQTVKENAKKLEQVSDKINRIRNYLSDIGSPLDALMTLYETLPLEVRISDIKFEEGQKFSVKGTSGTMGPVFAFVTNLEKSKKFTSVKTKYVTARNEGGKDVQDFEINTVFASSGQTL